MRKILFHISFLSLLFINIKAQEIPLFSQYLSNGLLLNPAYAGSKDVLSTSMMYRKQWAGFDQAPLYQTFSAHTPLKNKRIGIGIMLLNQSYAITKNTQISTCYSYRILLEKGVFAIGLKAGIQMARFGYNKIVTNLPDPTFMDAKEGYLLPNFGTGIYYNSKKYFFGFSIPNLLSYSEKSGESAYQISSDFKNYELLTTTGYLFEINNNFKIKPSTLIKLNHFYKSQIDINLNAIILNDKVWIGTSLRLKEAMVAILEYQISNELKVGYSMDYSIGKLDKSNTTSHEFNISYDFSYKIKAFNPRYF